MSALLSLGLLGCLGQLGRDEHGAALVEYAMLVGLIATVCLTAVAGFGHEVSDVFSYISVQFTPLGTL